MDPEKIMDEIRSLNQRLDAMTKTLSTLDQKIDNIAISQRIGDETMRKSANSITIIIRLLAGLRKLSSTELRNTLIESDALLNTVHPIPTTAQNADQIPVTNDRLKTILKEVFDVLNSLPAVDESLNQSTSTTMLLSNNTAIDKIKEEQKIQFWRKYKNKYNYIEKIKCKLPPLEDPAEESDSQQNSIINIAQNNVSVIVQNDSNDNTQNDLNSIVQNDLNDNTQNDVNDRTLSDVNGKFTIQDIIQNKAVYEILKSRLKNSPYDDPSFFKNNVRATQLNIQLANGDSVVKPMSCVAPLVVLKKFDDMCPLPAQIIKTMGKHFKSTSSRDSNKIKVNSSNRNNTSVKMNKRETRANTAKDKTNSSTTNVETSSKKRSLENKNSKNEPSKRRRN
ncbi:5'-AMP-activated serine/threonine-protein kinase catalytic subunit alpha-like [Rhopalosiphum maidis]|uniref:5'-AMP-activated serine/threonine-protein kinase catalytic subunit alpha-like n=1 Tax=Rhopalosiphum maidis TaxID=43146 RepID=UPI000F00E131|nr:5'-AMP-activated serine/threonine-protein kinase catalytic subunit alpha-like [Rhopalosiphum maidis]